MWAGAVNGLSFKVNAYFSSSLPSGSKGKWKESSTTENIPKVPTVSDEEDGKVIISWRGDGNFLAISLLDETDSGKRRIFVFSRDGILQSRSEAVPRLGPTLAWKPSGSLIASHVDHTIVFFEKNGLRHGEFNLEFQSEKWVVCLLEWSIDSSALAVVLREANLPMEASAKVLIYTMCNYHYYSSHQIDFPDGISDLRWDQENPLIFYTSDSEGNTKGETLRKCILKSNRDDGAVAVMDGPCVRITSFARANIPPPMYGKSICIPRSTEASVQHVSFHPTRDSFCALASDGNLYIYSAKDFTGPYLLEEEIKVTSLARQVIWMADETFVLLCSDSTVAILCPNVSKDDICTVGLEGNGLVLGSYSADTGLCLVHGDDGGVWKGGFTFGLIVV